MAWTIVFNLCEIKQIKSECRCYTYSTKPYLAGSQSICDIRVTEIPCTAVLLTFIAVRATLLRECTVVLGGTGLDVCSRHLIGGSFAGGIVPAMDVVAGNSALVVMAILH